MAEYIEREAAVSELNRIEKLYQNTYLSNVRAEMASYCCQVIKHIPAADVVEVRHGRWSMTKDGAAYCSACKRKMNPYLYGYAHCAMCGARMDGGVNRVDFDTVKNGGVNDGKAD